MQGSADRVPAKAAEEGAARENLDLLAQVIAKAEQEPTLISAQFRRWHRILSEMSREEILVLGRYIAGYEEAKRAGKDQLDAAIAGEQRAEADLVGRAKPLRHRVEVRAHLTALQRTGIVRNNGGLNGGAMLPTPGFTDLTRLIDFEAAAAEG